MNSIMDSALERLSGTSTEVLGGGDPNHGPMAVEALVTLGREERVLQWVDAYRRRLGVLHSPVAPIAHNEWPDALGRVDRIADWVTLFREELEQSPWTSVLENWLPRLIPGMVAAGTHGLLRTAHIARATGRQVTPQRLDELATALAYWAASYRVLLGSPPRLDGRQGIRLVLEHLPRVDVVQLYDGLPRDVIFRVDEYPSFLAALQGARMPVVIEEGLSELSLVGARAYMTNAGTNPLVLLHTVTAPAALRLLLPYIPRSAQPAAFAAVFHCVAAEMSLFAHDTTLASPEVEPSASVEDIIDRAIDTADPHAIKFVEACVREHRLNPQPIYLAAALDWVERLNAARGWTRDQRASAGIGFGPSM